MTNTKSASVLLALVLSAWSLHVSASRIELDPTVTNIAAGNIFAVDVVVSGFNAPSPSLALSDFDLDVSYDPLLLNAVGVSFGTGLGAPPDISGFDLASAGIVDLFAISFADYATLRGFQGDKFTLATLTFRALAPGTDSLAFVQDEAFIVDLINGDSQNPVNGVNPATCQSLACVDVSGARVVIGEANTVPEPNPLPLIAVGGLAIAAVRRRNTQRK
ncbi:MAG TPA: cohesin domain-containing protein [Casimicrobiaceae bacterium]|jgi:hypothetical protein|nr:cohesin domain-containing protein [Casimicrobiaceae bacterium]